MFGLEPSKHSHALGGRSLSRFPVRFPTRHLLWKGEEPPARTLGTATLSGPEAMAPAFEEALGKRKSADLGHLMLKFKALGVLAVMSM